MIFYPITVLYFMSWIFAAIIYLIALLIDARTHYSHARTIKISFLRFLFKHNKHSAKNIATTTFIIQLISIIFVLTSICLFIISFFVAELIVNWMLWIYFAIAFVTFITVSIFYCIKYCKVTEVQIYAKEDPKYIDAEKTIFGRKDLNSKINESEEENS